MKTWNVDIHWDFAKSIQVPAATLDEAVAKVEQMIADGEIGAYSLEPTDDYELDTTYQPEEL